MGFTRHMTAGCHTCKRRYVCKGHKSGGSWDEAQRLGWVWLLNSTLGRNIRFCPTCARKHASTKLFPGQSRNKPSQA